MKLYRDMTPEERESDDQDHRRAQRFLKYFAEERMAEYDSLPKWQRDERKETNNAW